MKRIQFFVRLVQVPWVKFIDEEFLEEEQASTHHCFFCWKFSMRGKEPEREVERERKENDLIEKVFTGYGMHARRDRVSIIYDLFKLPSVLSRHQRNFFFPV